MAQAKATILKGSVVPMHCSDFASYAIERFQHYDNAEAFINEQYSQSTITCREMISHIERLATVLHHQGIKQGDVIAIFATSSYRYMAAAVAGLKLGAAIVTTGSNLISKDIAVQWSNTNVKLAFCDDHLLAKAEAAADELAAKGHSYIKFINLGEHTPHPTPRLIGNYLDLINAVSRLDIPKVVIDVDATALILHSSGSTGVPKAVALSHKAVVGCLSSLFHGDTSKNNAKVFVVFSMAHAAGILFNFGYVLSGFTCIQTPAFDVLNMLRIIEQYKVERLAAPSSVAVLLVKGHIPHDISSLKIILFAASILGRELQLELEQRLRDNNCTAEITQLYGVTEHLGGLTYPHKGSLHKPGATGTVSPNVELKLVTPDGQLAPANTRGEVRVKGFSMKEYLNNPKATKESFDEEGFLCTGDIAYYDEDGYFYIVDRVKDLIKYMGQQVSPTEIEEVLLLHKSVKECAVIGVPSELEGELPLGVVVLKANETATESELIQFVNAKVADHKKLRGGIVFDEKLPRNAQGKLMKGDLKQKYKDHQRPEAKRRNISAEIRTLLEAEKKDEAKKVILSFIIEVVATELLGLQSNEVDKVDNSASLLEQGINSSGAILLRNALSASLGVSLPVTVVFEFPQPESLAEHLLTLIDDPSLHAKKLLEQVQQDIKQINSEINLQKATLHPLPTPGSVRRILFTGATGFVGCHLLAELILRTNATIHCVVRAKDDAAAFQRIEAKLRAQLCWTEAATDRIVAHAGDLSSPNLGIQSLSFFSEVDAIYHVGAVVNWVLPYSQMKENFTGVAEIINIISKGGRKIPFHLISTVGAVNVDVVMLGGRTVLEGLGGYPLSKWAGEQVAIHARSQGLPVTIFRLPLVTPHSTTGAANMEDELTRTILSCIEVGSVPAVSSNLPPFLSMAINELVSNIVSLSFSETTFHRNLVQYVNETGPSWHDIFETLHQSQGLQKLTLSQWSNHILS